MYVNLNELVFNMFYGILLYLVKRLYNTRNVDLRSRFTISEK